MDRDLIERLASADEARHIANHPVFDIAAGGKVDKKGVQHLVNQFWHPSHYFSSFLAGLVCVAPALEMKTSLSRILFQELGEGNPKRAHESIYIKMLGELGFDTKAIVEGAAEPETEALVNVFQRGSTDYLFGLGCIYGTEAIDLPIVSGLGRAVTAVTGETDLEWIEIHALQEPDHTESATAAVGSPLTAEEQQLVLEGATAIWNGWNSFYDAIEEKLVVDISLIDA